MNATQSRPRSGARGRTPLFRKVSRLLEQARVLERRPELGGFLSDW